jgi:sulfane dehydrogenase subunit SoxC
MSKGDGKLIANSGLKIRQIDALWNKAQEALIPQSEFFTIINQGGASALLGKYLEKGVLAPSKPTQAEMDFALMANQGYYTSNSLFFTHSHSSVPSVDIRNWKLIIEGDGVTNPLSINYNDLLKLPSTTVTRYLECASNGSAFYAELLNKKTEGHHWRFGSYGIAEWTGIQLAELLRLAKIRDNAVDVMPVGLDSPSGERPMPVVKAMEEDTILAYIMNNSILPPDHGFPLRAIVPGWVGAASIKWINKIVVSTKSINVTNNTDKYVFIGPEYAPQPPAKGPALTTQLVKSACCLPWPATLHAGHQKIVGYAWSPFGTIAKVEVSTDGGKTFQLATLTGPNIERAGSRWEFSFDAKPGVMSITPRATDDKGNTQYDISRQKWNKLGYLFEAMVPHPLTITAHYCNEHIYADYSMVIPPTSGCC